MADLRAAGRSGSKTITGGAGAAAPAPLLRTHEILPHIEALRAVAVLGVILFHLDPALCPGGYLGVDVFFVISGFLMARHIAAGLRDGTFNPIHFWQRRIARLLPALVVVLLAVGLAFPPLMLPGELKTLGASIAAAGAFVSNILFWRTTGYFSDPGTNPLLHIWTLGVEEQFYLLFPLAMLWARNSALKWVLAVSAVGLGWQIFAGPNYHVDNFFLLNARIWEFGSGAAIALHGTSGFTPRWSRESAALAGWALIALAFAFLPGGPSPWQHLASLVPVMAALLVITNGTGRAVAPLAESAAIQLAGRLSYSLYLWHMPLVVWLTMKRGAAGTPMMLAGVFTLTFVLASLTHRFVEAPCRAVLRRWQPRRVFALAIITAITFLLAGGWIWNMADRWHANTSEEAALMSHLKPDPVIRQCSLAPGKRIEDCPGYSPARRNILLMGDSHAGVIIDALRTRLSDANLADVRMAGCRPLLKWTYYGRCQLEKDHAFQTLIPSRRFATVILAADWKAGDIDELRQTILIIRRHGANVTLIGPGQHFQLGLIRLLLSHDPAQVARSRLPDQKAIDHDLRRLAHGLGIQYISRWDIECPQDRCIVRLASGAPLLFDAHHLTRQASDFEVSRFPDIR